MRVFETHRGIVAPLDRANVDTDQIIPKQFLKRLGKTGYEDCLFFNWRFMDDGMTLNPAFELNATRYKGASILLAKENFGCGSSRENAPWAIDNYGFRCIIAPSFADIFYKNAFNNGLLLISLPLAVVSQLFDEVRSHEGYKLTIDLRTKTIHRHRQAPLTFHIDPFVRDCLLNGWDSIDLTLQHEQDITAFELRARKRHQAE